MWAIVQTSLFVGLALLEGTLLPSAEPGTLNLLEDTTFLGYFFLLPVCFGLLYYSLLLFGRYLSHLDDVLEPESLPESKEHLLIQAQTEAAPERWKRERRLFIAMGFAVFAFNAIANFFPERFYGSPLKWDGIANPLGYTAGRIYVLLVWGYLLPTWASHVFLLLRLMSRLGATMVERRWLRISPYAADGFGGLGRLATVAAWLGYLIFAGSLIFLTPFIRQAIFNRPLHVGNYVGLAAYVCLAFIGIFTPVYVLHRGLAQKRREMLAFLTRAFDEINASVSQMIQENKPERLGEDNFGRAVETIDRLHTQWSSLPSWPVSLAVVLKFLATVVIPAVGYVLVQKLVAILAS